jgi:serine/threonine-protein kinase HipA
MAVPGNTKSLWVTRTQSIHRDFDVISAYPLVEKRQLEHRKMKMAMALHGKNTHYAYHEIMPGHWFDEAKKVSFPEAEMQFIIDETINHIESVIEAVSSHLPPEITENVGDAIFSDMKTAMDKF